MSFRQIALVLAPLVVACGSEPPAADIPTPVVEVEPAEIRTIDVTVDAVGIIEGDRTAKVSSGISGTVLSKHFEDGTLLSFAAGGAPILFRLDSALSASEIEGARRRVDMADSQIKEVRARVERQRELVEGKAAPASSLEDAQLALEQAEAAKSQAQSTVVSAQRRAGMATIRAPIPGVLSESLVNVGEYVQAGQDLVEVTDLTSLKVAFSVPDRDAHKLHLGQEVRIDLPALTGVALTGKLSYLAPRVSTNRTVHMHATLDTVDERMRPGTGAHVKVVVAAAKQEVVVAEEAIGYRKGHPYVYVVDGHAARLRPVEIARRLPGHVVIGSGLKRGELVVVRGLERVRDGMKVVARPVAGSDPPEGSPPRDGDSPPSAESPPAAPAAPPGGDKPLATPARTASP